MLGTPSESVWPGVSKLRDWHEFPQWRPQDLAKSIPELDADGIDLMQVRTAIRHTHPSQPTQLSRALP
jgi:hypothetical protein